MANIQFDAFKKSQAANVFRVSSTHGSSAGNSSSEEQQQSFFNCCCSLNRPKFISFCRIASSVYLPSRLNARTLRLLVPDRKQLVNFFLSSRSQGLHFANPAPPNQHKKHGATSMHFLDNEHHH
jgi:hypothetical protein